MPLGGIVAVLALVARFSLPLSLSPLLQLDVAALLITSREADFRVGVVFKGDLEADASSTPLILSGTPPAPDRLSLSITMVPDHVFAGRSSEEFLDPAEDPVWVLVHDEGTSDAQFFSMTLNGTASIVCFKDAEAAERCSSALINKGTSAAAPRSQLCTTCEEGKYQGSEGATACTPCGDGFTCPEGSSAPTPVRRSAARTHHSPRSLACCESASPVAATGLVCTGHISQRHARTDTQRSDGRVHHLHRRKLVCRWRVGAATVLPRRLLPRGLYRVDRLSSGTLPGR